MRLILALSALYYICCLMSCTSHNKKDIGLPGIWQSLWEKDMHLQLQLDTAHQFKVTLIRTGQTHTNIGWYNIEDNIFLIKDSINYPLPVCNIADTGRYNFSIVNDTLLFKVIDDKCERRSAALQLDRFVRVK